MYIVGEINEQFTCAKCGAIVYKGYLIKIANSTVKWCEDCVKNTSDIIRPVTSIKGVPRKATVRSPLVLTGEPNPFDNISKTILWSVINAGKTGATISGNTLNTKSAGTIIIRATIINGRAPDKNFTQNFIILVSSERKNKMVEFVTKYKLLVCAILIPIIFILGYVGYNIFNNFFEREQDFFENKLKIENSLDLTQISPEPDLYLPRFIGQTFFENNILLAITDQIVKNRMNSYYSLMNSSNIVDMDFKGFSKEGSFLSYAFSRQGKFYVLDPNINEREIKILLDIFREHLNFNVNDIFQMYRESGIHIIQHPIDSSTQPPPIIDMLPATPQLPPTTMPPPVIDMTPVATQPTTIEPITQPPPKIDLN